MGYNIPYTSDYEAWYGAPQNVTRISANMVQTKNADGVLVGRITASWNIPDNGGTFKVLTSTDGVDYYVARSGVDGNSVVLDVEPNTAYYLKVVTVLGASESTGTVSELIGVGTIPTPPTPTVTVTSGGIQIDVGYIPPGYTVDIVIGSKTINTNQSTAMYLCDNGTYTVKTAYRDSFGNIGSYSTTVTVTKGADYEIRTGDTITNTTLQSLITEQQPISINGETYYFVKLDDGTYYYSNAFHNITVNSDWEITITDSSNDVYNLKTPVIGQYTIEDDGSGYFITNANDMVLDNASGPTRKSNAGPALCGYFHSGDWMVPLLISTSADAVTMYRGPSGAGYDVETYDGIYHDPETNIDWYYNAYYQNLNHWGSQEITVDTPVIANGQNITALMAVQQLLKDETPAIVPTASVEENLFYPVDVVLDSGDTITDTTLKSLIAYYRPIRVNNETLYFSRLENGTYYYQGLNHALEVASDWEVTITDSGGNVFNLKTPLLNGYSLVEDKSNYYIATAQGLVLDNPSGPTRKTTATPALRGYYHNGDWAVPLLMSLVADGVTMHRGGAAVDYDTEGYEGIYHDPVRNLDWYYNGYYQNLNHWGSWTPGEEFPVLANGDSISISAACAALLEQADPKLIVTEMIEEDLFSPTNFTLTSGDTISNNTLKALIAYHRPISVNGATFLPSSYSNGTYTYYAINNGTTTEILKAAINSSWVITITKEDTGGAVASVNGQTGTVVLDTDDISEGSTNLYYTAQRFNTAFDNKAGDADDLAAGVDTDNHSWSAKTLHDYLQGTATFELDANGDIQPCADPKPSLFWDIDTNGDIMPSAQVWWQSANGNLIPE